MFPSHGEERGGGEIESLFVSNAYLKYALDLSRPKGKGHPSAHPGLAGPDPLATASPRLGREMIARCRKLYILNGYISAKGHLWREVLNKSVIIKDLNGNTTDCIVKLIYARKPLSGTEANLSGGKMTNDLWVWDRLRVLGVGNLAYGFTMIGYDQESGCTKSLDKLQDAWPYKVVQLVFEKPTEILDAGIEEYQRSYDTTLKFTLAGEWLMRLDAPQSLNQFRAISKSDDTILVSGLFLTRS